MKNSNLYLINIFLDRDTNLEINHNAEYLNGGQKIDDVRIYHNHISIRCIRSNVININSIFDSENSIKKQVTKAVTLAYILFGKYFKITKILITRSRSGSNFTISSFTYEKENIRQLVDNSYNHNFIMEVQSIADILNETEKSKTLLIAFVYFIRANSTDNIYSKFENLYKCFNKIYMFNQPNYNDANARKNLRTRILANHTLFKLSSSLFNTTTVDELRNNYSWRSLILNDYKDISKTGAFKDFILRYTDYRIMTMISQMLVYRENNLKIENMYTDVLDHINLHITMHTINNLEIATLLSIKYSFFLRNKLFHGEILDHSYDFKITKSEKEMQSIVILLNTLNYELLNNLNIFI